MSSTFVIQENVKLEKLFKLYNEADLTLQEKNCVSNMIKKVKKDGFNSVSYKNTGIRITAANPCIQYLSAYSRSFLCNEDYFDLDMKSCALNILKSLIHNYEMDDFYEIIDKIIHIKENVIEDKVQVNKFLFGQSQLNGLTKQEIYIFKQMREKINSKYPDIIKKIKKDNVVAEAQRDGKVLSHIIYHYERLCINSAIEYFNESNIEYATIVFDGIHVKEITEDQIEELVDYIQQNTDMITKWVIKPWVEVPESFFKETSNGSISSLGSDDKEDIINSVFCDFIDWACDNRYVRLEKTTKVLQLEDVGYYGNQVLNTHEDTINAFCHYCRKKPDYTIYGSVDKNTEKIDKALKSFLKNQRPHESFPVVKKDMRYIGYKNGVFDLHNQSFLTGENIPEGMLVRKYFDEDFNPLTELPKEMLHIFKCQKWTEETINCYCALLGRLYFPINTFDDWGQILINLGISGTGKSTILENVIADNMEDSDTRSSKDARFNLGGANNRELLFFGEAENIHNAFESDVIKKLARGEKTAIEGKHVAQESEKWTTPIAMNSNHKLNYNDSSGGIANRFTYFKYNYIVSRNGSIKDNLVKLAPRLIPLLIQNYFDMVKSGFIKGEQIEGWCMEIDEDANDFLTWYNTPNEDLYTQIVFKEGSMVSIVEMKKNWTNYWKFALNKSGEPKKLDENDFSHLQKNNITYDRIHICKSCGNKHNKDCCKNYSRTNRTTKKVFMNCCLITGGLHPDNKRFNGRSRGERGSTTGNEVEEEVLTDEDC
jgi:hypothetical protein